MSTPHSIDGLLLCVLRAGPSYGQSLAEHIASIDSSVRLRQGTLYPALRRLEEAALARSHEVPQRADRGGRPKRVYTLTPKGKRRADQLARFFSAIASPTKRAAA